MIYRDKTMKRITLKQSYHPKLRGLYRMIIVSLSDHWNMALRGRGINNPWLPEREAMENMKEHAQRLGWKEERRRRNAYKGDCDCNSGN